MSLVADNPRSRNGIRNAQSEIRVAICVRCCFLTTLSRGPFVDSSPFTGTRSKAGFFEAKALTVTVCDCVCVRAHVFVYVCVCVHAGMCVMSYAGCTWFVLRPFASCELCNFLHKSCIRAPLKHGLQVGIRRSPSSLGLPLPQGLLRPV